MEVFLWWSQIIAFILRGECLIKAGTYSFPSLPVHLLVFSVEFEIHLEMIMIGIESQFHHGIDDIISSDRLPLFVLEEFTGLTRDEPDEFGHTFLDGILGILGDLGVLGYGPLHNTVDIGDGEEPVLVSDEVLRLVHVKISCVFCPLYASALFSRVFPPFLGLAHLL